MLAINSALFKEIAIEYKQTAYKQTGAMNTFNNSLCFLGFLV